RDRSRSQRLSRADVSEKAILENLRRRMPSAGRGEVLTRAKLRVTQALSTAARPAAPRPAARADASADASEASAELRSQRDRRTDAAQRETHRDRSVKVVAMLARHEIVRILRDAGFPEVAEEAERSLPDEVDLERAIQFGAQHGVTRDE